MSGILFTRPLRHEYSSNENANIMFESAVKARYHLDGPGAIQRLLKHVWYTHFTAIGVTIIRSDEVVVECCG